MDECLHTELIFGSGDYYIICANWRCGRKWAVVGDGDKAAPELSNKGKQVHLSGYRRVELPVDDGK